MIDILDLAYAQYKRVLYRESYIYRVFIRENKQTEKTNKEKF